MNGEDRKAVVNFAGPDLFVGITPSNHAVAIDTNPERNSAPTPMELLLVALGSCTGVDVLSILEKKRETVTAYRVEVRGQRREQHPRSYNLIHVHHIITGDNVSDRAVQQAVKLSDEKYCSVAATLRPAAEIVSTFEIIQEPATRVGAEKS